MNKNQKPELTNGEPTVVLCHYKKNQPFLAYHDGAYWKHGSTGEVVDLDFTWQPLPEPQNPYLQLSDEVLAEAHDLIFENEGLSEKEKTMYVKDHIKGRENWSQSFDQVKEFIHFLDSKI